MHGTEETTAGKQTPTYEFTDRSPEERLRELILYIADQCEEEPTFGAVMLNKILWATDAVSYVKTGTPVTGSAYIKLPNGPVPEQMKAILTKMEKNGELFIHERNRFGYTQKRVIALRDADLTSFSAADIALVSTMIQTLCRHTAKEVSLMSHNRAWEIAAVGERIPYEAIFLSDESVTEEDEEWAHRMKQKYNWGEV